MIDEKTLGLLDLRGYLSKEHAKEILRLAQLGIWAEKQAIPAITHYARDGHVGSHTSGHGESSEHISFYYGLKIKPMDVLLTLPDIEQRYPEKP